MSNSLHNFHQSLLCLNAVILERTLLNDFWQKQGDKILPKTKAWSYLSLRFYPKNQCIIDHLCTQPANTIKQKHMQHILHMALTLILYTDMPHYAVVSTAVSCCRKHKLSWAAKLVNGICRRFLREQKRIEKVLKNNPAYEYNHPIWLMNAFQSDWPDKWQSIIQANDQQAPLFCRINPLVTSRCDYLKTLSDASISAQCIDLLPDAIVLNNPCHPRMLPLWSAGALSVQDLSGQCLSLILSTLPTPHRILDACAAPGSKTSLCLAQFPTSQVIANDINATRLLRVKDNLKRLQCTGEYTNHDILKPPKHWQASPFDLILFDAPCTGSGVIRRHPDIKLNRQPSDITTQSHRQQKGLDALWACLKPGGFLIYSTCSVFRDENDRLIANWLKKNPLAKLHPIDLPWGNPQTPGWQLLPGEQGADGFYFACLQK